MQKQHCDFLFFDNGKLFSHEENCYSSEQFWLVQFVTGQLDEISTT